MKPKKKTKKVKKPTNGHGGFRENAGRKAIEQTVVMRIPKSKVDSVKQFIGSNIPAEYRERHESQSQKIGTTGNQ